MSATGESATGRGVLLQQVLELVSERVAGEPAEVVAEFARAYSRRLPADADLDAEQLYGHVIGLFELADRRGEKPIAVRVFNATPAVDGYRSGGTVVETNTDDIPFLVDSVRDALQARDLSIGLLLHPVIGT